MNPGRLSASLASVSVKPQGTARRASAKFQRAQPSSREQQRRRAQMTFLGNDIGHEWKLKHPKG